PETLRSMWGMASILVQLSRGAEAVPVIDDCVRRTAGRPVDGRLVPTVMQLRIRHFQKSDDAAGCRATAEMWERLSRTAGGSLYDAACMRPVAAAMFAKTGQGDESSADADRAMAWLTKAVTAGYKDRAHMEQDADLDALRGRDDFRTLVGKLPATAKPN